MPALKVVPGVASRPPETAPPVAPPQHASARLDPLPETASLLLDVVRFSLCLLVLAGHATQRVFSTGWPPLINLANAAVPGFFVLSGFVIRYVTQTRERDGRRYGISRASRIYSVVLPAIALTVVLDRISLHTSPAYYTAVSRPDTTATAVGAIGVNLLFLTQIWGHAGLLLSNIPFWSLGYEVPYYVLFGIAAFTQGRTRVALLAAACLLFGPQILFLLPIWWSGIWLYDGWQWLRQPGRSAWRIGAVAVAMALLAWLLLPADGVNGFVRIRDLPNPLVLLGHPAQRAGMFEYASGLLSLASLLLLLCASDLLRLPKKTSAARAIRRVAEGTFTLYLFHYPMLVCAAALHLYRPDRSRDKLLLLAAIVVLCVLAAIPVAAFKDWLRATLSAAFVRTSAQR